MWLCCSRNDPRYLQVHNQGVSQIHTDKFWKDNVLEELRKM